MSKGLLRATGVLGDKWLGSHVSNLLGGCGLRLPYKVVSPLPSSFVEAVTVRRQFSTYEIPKKTQLISACPILPISAFKGLKREEEISESSAHDIYTAQMSGNTYYLKDRATHKEFPVSKRYSDPVMAVAYSRFLAEKEVMHTRIAMALLGEERIPQTCIVADNLDKPTRFFVASRKLSDYISLDEVRGKRDLDEIFYVGKEGETRLKGYYRDPKGDGHKAFDVHVSGRIEAKNTRMCLGETDPNPKNSGVRPVRDKGLICMIDFDACGQRVLYTPAELAFSAPHSVVTVLHMPATEYTRLKRRAIVKQGIFDRIGAINHDELVQNVTDHFCKESHNLFDDKISILRNNLVEGISKFAEAGRLHRMACKSLLGQDIIR